MVVVESDTTVHETLVRNGSTPRLLCLHPRQKGFVASCIEG